MNVTSEIDQQTDHHARPVPPEYSKKIDHLNAEADASKLKARQLEQEGIARMEQEKVLREKVALARARLERLKLRNPAVELERAETFIVENLHLKDTVEAQRDIGFALTDFAQLPGLVKLMPKIIARAKSDLASAERTLADFLGNNRQCA